HPVQRVQVDGHRQELTIHARQHMMLIRTPFRELRQILENFPAVGVKNVRTVTMHEDPVLVVVVKCVPPDMGTSVDQEHGFSSGSRESLRNNTSREACADD